MSSVGADTECVCSVVHVWIGGFSECEVVEWFKAEVLGVYVDGDGFIDRGVCVTHALVEVCFGFGAYWDVDRDTVVRLAAACDIFDGNYIVSKGGPDGDAWFPDGVVGVVCDGYVDSGVLSCFGSGDVAVDRDVWLWGRDGLVN